MKSSTGFFFLGFLAGVVATLGVRALQNREVEETIEDLSQRILDDLRELETRTADEVV